MAGAQRGDRMGGGEQPEQGAGGEGLASDRSKGGGGKWPQCRAGGAQWPHAVVVPLAGPVRHCLCRTVPRLWHCLCHKAQGLGWLPQFTHIHTPQPPQGTALIKSFQILNWKTI